MLLIVMAIKPYIFIMFIFKYLHSSHAVDVQAKLTSCFCVSFVGKNGVAHESYGSSAS